jgi:ribose-phosphate pyrophosphokinase
MPTATKQRILVLPLNTDAYVQEAETQPYEVVKVAYERSTFPFGEVFFRLSDPVRISGQAILITARLRNSDDILALLNATDALRNAYAASVTLKLYYVPYGRQDRIANVGESLSLKVFAKLLNSQKYERVIILEPHSDVTSYALDRLTVQTASSVGFSAYVREKLTKAHGGPGLENVVVVSTDAGGAKRLDRMAQELGILDTAKGDKHRDLETNKLSHFSCDRADFAGKVALMVDDLCDGGGTFIGLAEVLLAQGASAVYLMVTQGGFTSGFDRFKGKISRVFTTNSFRDVLKEVPQVEGVQVDEYQLNLF